MRDAHHQAQTPQQTQIQLQIRAEQASSIFGRIYFAVVSTILVCIVVWYVCHDNPAIHYLLPWLASVMLILAVRLAIAAIWRSRPTQLAARSLIAYTVATFASGVAWSVYILLFAPPVAIEYQLTMQIVVVGFCAGALLSNYAYLPAVFAYIAPVLTAGFVYNAMAAAAHRIFIILVVCYPTYSVCIVALAYRINRDFIENKKLQYALIEQREAAERANLAKSQFLAATSHDLRQPLHAITLFNGALKSRIADGESSQLVENIERSIEALGSLFNGLLDISKLDAGTLETNPQNVLLDDILAPLKNEFEILARDKNLRFEMQSGNTAVYADVEVLRRILRNLIANAIRYTNTGSVLVKIDPSVSAITLRVIDTGIGIDPEFQKKIFEEYVQLNNPERDRTKGLGLGLAIVKRLCDLMHYQLTIESNPERGSCFAVTVPRAQAAAVQMSQASDDVADIAAFHGMRVAIIDDEEAVRAGTRILLEDWGCEVTTHASKAEAIDTLIQFERPPEMILADYRLQQNDTGAAAIRAIEQHFGVEIPAAIITGDTDPQRIKEATESGYLLLHKPLRLLQLRAALNRGKRLRRQTAGVN